MSNILTIYTPNPGNMIIPEDNRKRYTTEFLIAEYRLNKDLVVGGTYTALLFGERNPQTQRFGLWLNGARDFTCHFYPVAGLENCFKATFVVNKDFINESYKRSIRIYNVGSPRIDATIENICLVEGNVAFDELFMGGVYLSDYTLTLNRMGIPSLTTSFMHGICLGDYLTGDEYVDIHNQRFYIRREPSSGKDNDDERYKHEITFYSEHEILSDVYFFDVVTNNSATEYKPITNSTTVKFYGNIIEFVDRLNCTLFKNGIGDSILATKTHLTATDKPTGDGYCAIVSTEGGYDLDVTKEVAFDDKKIWDALGEIYKTFNVPFALDGKKIIFGGVHPTVDAVFKYGVDDELLSVSKKDSNNLIINEITAVGGTENIPHYYPNPSPFGELFIGTKFGLSEQNVVIANQDLLLATLPKETPITYVKSLDADGTFLGVKLYNEYDASQEEQTIARNTQIKIPLRKVRASKEAVCLRELFGDYFANQAIITESRPKISAFDLKMQVRVNKTGKLKLDILSSVYGVSPLEGQWATWVPSSATTGHNFYPLRVTQVTWDEDVEDNTRGRLNPTARIVNGEIILDCKVTGTIEICGTTYLWKKWDDYVNTKDNWAILLLSGVTIDSGGEPTYSYYWNDGVTDMQLKDYGLQIININEEDIPVGAQIMWSSRNLLPYLGHLTIPKFIETKGSERFYKALNDTYHLPDGTGYYVFPNPYDAQHPTQHVHTDETIKPTIEGIENHQGQLLGEIADIAYDTNDNDSTSMTDEGEYLHSFFYLKLHIFDGMDGFDLFKSAIETDAMTLQMTSGNCNGCKFPIQASSFTDSEDGFQHNPVQVVDYVLKSSDYVFKDFNSGTNASNHTISLDSTTIGNLVSGYRVYVDFDYEHNLTFGNTNAAIRLNIGTGLNSITISDAITPTSPRKGHMRRIETMPSGITADMTSTPFLRFDYVNGGSFTIRNLSITKVDSEIVEGDYDQKVNLEHLQYAQQNTQENAIWICVRKDTDTFGVIMPNREKNYLPSIGDKFNIVNIKLPASYLRHAERLLESSMLDKMATNNEQRFNFEIGLSRIWVKQNKAIADSINENSKIVVRYDNRDYEQYISQITYEFRAEDILPEMRVSLENELTVTDSFVERTAADAVALLPNAANQPSTTPAPTSGVDLRKLYKDLDKRYLRKDVDDTTNGTLATTRGLEVAPYLSGISGGRFGIDANGNTYLETDILNVRKTAFFQVLDVVHTESIGGKQIISPGGSLEITYVEAFNLDSEYIEARYYHCYYKSKDNDDSEIECRLQAGDYVICQNFNAKEGAANNISNKFYWRYVAEVTPEYIVLSNRMSTAIDSEPEAGDVIVQLGNMSDVMRQNAIVLSTVDSNAPSQYFFSGISSTSLTDCNVIEMGVDNATGQPFLHVYGEAYVGAKDGSTYVKFTPQNGVEVKGKITASSTIDDTPIDKYVANTTDVENTNLIGNSGYFLDISGWEYASDASRPSFAIANLNTMGAVLKLTSGVVAGGTYVELRTRRVLNKGNIYGTIVSGHTYTLSFYVMGTAYATISVNISLDADKTSKMFARDLTFGILSSRWNRFVFTFTAEQDLTDDAFIYINCPIERVSQGFYMTKISLTESARALPWVESSLSIMEDISKQGETFTSDTLPTPPYKVNDLWFRTTDGKSGDLLRCVVARSIGATATASDWVDATNYDSTQTVVDGGIVTSGRIQLAGDNVAADGTVTKGAIKAGITGEGTAENSVRIWAGSAYGTRDEAPFRVLQNGKLYAKNATIDGSISARMLTLTPSLESGIVATSFIAHLYDEDDSRSEQAIFTFPALSVNEVRSVDLLRTSIKGYASVNMQTMLRGADSTTRIGLARHPLVGYSQNFIMSGGSVPLGMYKCMGFNFNGTTYWSVSLYSVDI